MQVITITGRGTLRVWDIRRLTVTQTFTLPAPCAFVNVVHDPIAPLVYLFGPGLSVWKLLPVRGNEVGAAHAALQEGFNKGILGIVSRTSEAHVADGEEDDTSLRALLLQRKIEGYTSGPPTPSSKPDGDDTEDALVPAAPQSKGLHQLLQRHRHGQRTHATILLDRMEGEVERERDDLNTIGHGGFHGREGEGEEEGDEGMVEVKDEEHSRVVGIGWSKEYCELVIIRLDGWVERFDASNGRRTVAFQAVTPSVGEDELTWQITAAVLDGHGRRLITAASFSVRTTAAAANQLPGSRVHIWNLANGTLLRTLVPLHREVACLGVASLSPVNEVSQDGSGIPDR